MASVVGHVFFVPQLLMLVLVAEEKTSMVLQFIFMVIIFLVTATTRHSCPFEHHQGQERGDVQ